MLNQLEPYRVTHQQGIGLFRAAQQNGGTDARDVRYRVRVLKIAPLEIRVPQKDHSSE